MYYLKHAYECFIRYKTRGEAERFIPDKARLQVAQLQSQRYGTKKEMNWGRQGHFVE